LTFILSYEGYLISNATSYDHEYFIKDHLGNKRLTVKDNNVIALVVQEDHYDPFGMVLSGQSTPNTVDADKRK